MSDNAHPFHYIYVLSFKALRKTEFSELFVFASFGIARLSKFGIFLEISGLFELRENSSEIISEIISCFRVKKPCF